MLISIDARVARGSISNPALGCCATAPGVPDPVCSADRLSIERRLRQAGPALRRSDLTLLFDGGCPLCLREVNFLRRRDRSQRLSFVDINAIDYNASEHANISYRQAMGRIHAIRGTGEILTDVAVFREAY
ncbi:MAG: thiol-disulfide oxidoreductase DCC family protein, partial [Synechococcus sp.]